MRTKDGYIAVAPYQDSRWIKFLEIAGRTEVLQEPGLTDWMLRRKNASRLYEHMAACLPEKTTDEWLKLLNEANIPATRINSLDDLLDDPQLKAAELFVEREHPTEGRYIEVRPPVRFSAHEYGELRHAPLTGEHTEEVARELGVVMTTD
jgi:crotonobetainyl-CoA:carnitine CoA-transferase CaiB-like acyl-CoA transferase